MKRLSAHYIFTNAGPVLKRAVISILDDGTIAGIAENRGELNEIHSTEFYNGIIVPGFINCHCHLELSHMKGSAARGAGLEHFIRQIRNNRNNRSQEILSAALSADSSMYDEGVVACADICNTTDTFPIKKESRIYYLNLLEVFGLDPEKAVKRMNEIKNVAATAVKMGLPFSLVPHSAYSMSVSLFRLLDSERINSSVTSIHFLENRGEISFLKDHSGPLMESYKQSGLIPPRLETPECHADVIQHHISGQGNIILVHNTYVDRQTINAIKKREKLYWCLCPNSNIYIENTMPPVKLLLEENCIIVTGTDSLASNSKLSILEELKTLQNNFPDIPLEDLIRWSTINGARAIGKEKCFGSIEPGKKPGLLLIENVDLQELKLLPESFARRLI